uniref:Uncharacterized protein n=1 Tax=Panagrolaimus davidi TaxID=227884 RepID=A0A914Q6K7_9BILA
MVSDNIGVDKATNKTAPRFGQTTNTVGGRFIDGDHYGTSVNVDPGYGRGTHVTGNNNGHLSNHGMGYPSHITVDKDNNGLINNSTSWTRAAKNFGPNKSFTFDTDYRKSNSENDNHKFSTENNYQKPSGFLINKGNEVGWHSAGVRVDGKNRGIVVDNSDGSQSYFGALKSWFGWKSRDAGVHVKGDNNGCINNN